MKGAMRPISISSINGSLRQSPSSPTSSESLLNITKASTTTTTTLPQLELKPDVCTEIAWKQITRVQQITRQSKDGDHVYVTCPFEHLMNKIANTSSGEHER